MDFLPEELEKYVELHTSEEPEILKKLSRETYAKVLMPRMLSGHIQGRFLKMICGMIQPKQVLEVGTFTGYSSICLSESLAPGGLIHTIDINEELSEMVNRYINEAGAEKKIKTYIGSALNIIPTIKETFDLVFIDADKKNYKNYFNLVIDRVRMGGYIMADNALWSGKVLEEQNKTDEETLGIIEYNNMVMKDKRVDSILVPIRDGIMISKKIA